MTPSQLFDRRLKLKLAMFNHWVIIMIGNCGRLDVKNKGYLINFPTQIGPVILIKTPTPIVEPTIQNINHLVASFAFIFKPFKF